MFGARTGSGLSTVRSHSHPQKSVAHAQAQLHHLGTKEQVLSAGLYAETTDAWMSSIVAAEFETTRPIMRKAGVQPQ